MLTKYTNLIVRNLRGQFVKGNKPDARKMQILTIYDKIITKDNKMRLLEKTPPLHLTKNVVFSIVEKVEKEFAKNKNIRAKFLDLTINIPEKMPAKDRYIMNIFETNPYFFEWSNEDIRGFKITFFFDKYHPVSRYVFVRDYVQLFSKMAQGLIGSKHFYTNDFDSAHLLQIQIQEVEYYTMLDMVKTDKTKLSRIGKPMPMLFADRMKRK